MTFAQIRTNRFAHLAKLRHLYPIPGPIPSEVRETTHQIPARGGHNIPVKVYSPVSVPTSGSASPLVVMLHEGGWCLGDWTDEDQNCRLFARELGAVCVNVDYRLAPEHPFPAGLQDCQDALQWCATTAAPGHAVLPADPAAAGFLVGGSSAGGNLAAVLCQTSRDEGLSPPLTGQWLCVPSLLWAGAVPEKWAAECRSRATALSDPVLQLPLDQEPSAFQRALKVDASTPLFSPLIHPDLKGLPPAYFQVAGMDPLRDEGLLYERVLREENGVPTRIDVYEGYGHMFWTNWPELQRSTEFVQDSLEGVRWLLKTGAENGNRQDRS